MGWCRDGWLDNYTRINEGGYEYDLYYSIELELLEMIQSDYKNVAQELKVGRLQELYSQTKEWLEELEDQENDSVYDKAWMDKAEAIFYELQDFCRKPEEYKVIINDEQRGFYGIFNQKDIDKIQTFQAMYDQTVQTLEPALKDFCERNHLEYTEGSVAETLRNRMPIKVCQFSSNPYVALFLDPNFNREDFYKPNPDGVSWQPLLITDEEQNKLVGLNLELNDIVINWNKELEKNGGDIYTNKNAFQSSNQLIQALDKDIFKDFIKETEKEISLVFGKDNDFNR